MQMGKATDDLKKSQVENALQKPPTALKDYYEFWFHINSNSHTCTCFFVMLAQKLISAEKSGRTSTGDIATGVSNASVLATLLQLVLYYKVQADDKDVKALTKKNPSKAPASAMDGLAIDTLLAMVGQADSTRNVIDMVDLCTNMDMPGPTATGDVSVIAYGLISGFLQRCVQQNQHVASIIKTLLGILRLGQPLLTIPRAL
eukprot:CAMPEP_0119324236 /NCGR_PEP_ID=MMETSP1333-20130426/62656_1 /TAXON_ID=418940 /ORGANISM="Scyphosphaera apsteinii, Strain RCC1455" /LENGTH=201 /DNA_ID=CAMNT_0007331893 /DNA_START=98 /DNA_END=700 /DNA_ORIENTATION=+